MSFERIAAVATAIVVAGGLVAGFAVTGSPSHQRAVQLDQRRIEDLRRLSTRIDRRYGRQSGTGAPLPAQLASSDRPRRPDGSDGTRDPASNLPYAYAREDIGHYRLCAVFTTVVSAGDAGYDSWPHPAGHACWRFDLAHPLERRPTESPELIHERAVASSHDAPLPRRPRNRSIDLRAGSHDPCGRHTLHVASPPEPRSPFAYERSTVRFSRAQCWRRMGMV